MKSPWVNSTFFPEGRILETCFGASAADASCARGTEYGPWAALVVGAKGAGVQGFYVEIRLLRLCDSRLIGVLGCDVVELC